MFIADIAGRSRCCRGLSMATKHDCQNIHGDLEVPDPYDEEE